MGKGETAAMAATGDAMGAGELELWLQHEERKRGSWIWLSSGLETA